VYIFKATVKYEFPYNGALVVLFSSCTRLQIKLIEFVAGFLMSGGRNLFF
jgi:hypothetical protein